MTARTSSGLEWSALKQLCCERPWKRRRKYELETVCRKAVVAAGSGKSLPRGATALLKLLTAYLRRAAEDARISNVAPRTYQWSSTNKVTASSEEFLSYVFKHSSVFILEVRVMQSKRRTQIPLFNNQRWRPAGARSKPYDGPPVLVLPHNGQREDFQRAALNALCGEVAFDVVVPDVLRMSSEQYKSQQLGFDSAFPLSPRKRGIASCSRRGNFGIFYVVCQKHKLTR